jgi:hypothetical protein
MRTCVLIALVVSCAVNVLAQQTSSEAKAQTIAAAFNKQKFVPFVG